MPKLLIMETNPIATPLKSFHPKDYEEARRLLDTHATNSTQIQRPGVLQTSQLQNLQGGESRDEEMDRLEQEKVLQ